MRRGGHKLVRDAQGAERVSSARLYCAPGKAAAVPPGSRVSWTVGGKVRSTVVLAVLDQDSGGLGAPDHTEVVCE